MVIDTDMINPYESTATVSGVERRRWRHVIAPLAGIVGYCAPMVALVLMSWLVNGWTVAWENLERVIRIHREPSLNTFVTFIPHLALAFFVAMATIEQVGPGCFHRRWWMIGCVTIVGYIIVLYSVERWNLIPWTWPAVLSNAARSALTLMFPLVAFVVADLRARRSFD